MKKLITVLVTITLALNSYAQETVIFETTKKSTSSKPKTKKESTQTNIIKISPLSFISGFIPVFYERKINDFFTIQGGLGITTKNYIQDAIYAETDGTSASTFKKLTWTDGKTYRESDIENQLYGGDYRKNTLGYIISVEPRLYFASESPEGAFIGFNFSKRRNNYNSKTVSNSPVNTPIVYSGTTKEFDNLTTAMVNIGSQVMYDNLSLEYTAGIGLRKIVGQHYIYTGASTTNKYVSGIGYVDRTAVAFDLSIKVGYHF
jgi:hypothetical protein